MICRKCSWWVEETEVIGEYEHSEALKQNKGFCLVQDLFTNKEPDDECDCGEYNEQKLQKDTNRNR